MVKCFLETATEARHVAYGSLNDAEFEALRRIYRFLFCHVGRINDGFISEDAAREAKCEVIEAIELCSDPEDLFPGYWGPCGIDEYPTEPEDDSFDADDYVDSNVLFQAMEEVEREKCFENLVKELQRISFLRGEDKLKLIDIIMSK